MVLFFFFFFSSRRRHTRSLCDWSSDVCSSDLCFDYTTKTKHVERFLNEGSKVKITIMFRGREMAHPELGKKILDRIAEQVKDVGNVEAAPRVDGRNMLMVLAPVKKQEPKGGASKPRPPRPDEPPAP